MTKKETWGEMDPEGFCFRCFRRGSFEPHRFFLMSQYAPETLLKVFTGFLVWFLGLFLLLNNG